MMGEPNQRTVDFLKSLENFDDPIGPAARLQTDRLMRELRKAAIENPITTYRMTEDGPEQTPAEILAELDADEAFIEALRKALDEGDHAA